MSTPATRANVLWLSLLSKAVVFCVVAAFAVSSAFGSAFVQDAVAAGVVTYSAAFIGIFFGVRAESTHWSQRRGIRAVFAAACALLVLYLLRTVLLFALPWSAFQQTGFSPYVVLVLGGTLPVLLLEAAYVFGAKGAAGGSLQVGAAASTKGGSTVTKRAPSE